MRFLDSAFKHDITEEDARHALLNHEARGETSPRSPKGRAYMFVGHPHPQTDRYLEVGAELREDGEIVVFHAMDLTDKWRWLLYEED